MDESQLRDLFTQHKPIEEPPLVGSFATETLAGGQRRLRRRRLFQGAVGTGTAVVAAVAVFLASGGSADSKPAQAGGTSRSSATASPTVVETTVARPTTPPVDAVSLLTGASQVASVRQATVRDNQFIYSKHRILHLVGTSSDSPASDSESWVSVDGSQTGWAYDSAGKTGSPISYDLPGISSPSLASPNYKFLTTVTTDPAKLLAELRGRMTQPSDKYLDRDQYVFQSLGIILANPPLHPGKVDATIYQAAAMIPGVKLVPDVLDAAGRHMMAVERTSSDEVGTEQWLFDPITYEYRGFVNTGVYSDGVTRTNSVALVRVAVVDQVKQQPK